MDIVAPSPNPDPTLFTDFMLVRNLVYKVDNHVLTRLHGKKSLDGQDKKARV